MSAIETPFPGVCVSGQLSLSEHQSPLCGFRTFPPSEEHPHLLAVGLHFPAPFSQALASTNLLSVLEDLTVLEISFKWNDGPCGLSNWLLLLSTGFHIGFQAQPL